MGPLDILFHLLHFIAPAAFLAVLLPVGSRWAWGRAISGRPGWGVQVGVNLAVGAAVLVAGLVLQGRDGKMLTYAALAVGMATSQWLLLKPWR